ncbi:MAG TPA: arginine--tRNA ligase, partial [Dehalococcoidia bacterium]|nr:arginine--tRNA ligase [Dehalococcoidia bacterium]
MNIREEIARLIAQAVDQVQKEGKLPPLEPEVTIERPPRPEMGDYATSLPLRLARAARLDPVAVAQAIASAIPRSEVVAKVEVATPGFLNFHLS